MAPAATDQERGVEDRGVSRAPAWAVPPPVWGEPVTWDKVRRDLAEMERKKVFRFGRPDGSKYETTWVDASQAKAWANVVGDSYLGEVARRTEPPASSVEPQASRGTTDRGLSPPPLVQADVRPPPPKRREVPKPEPPKPPAAEKKRRPPVPSPKPEEYGLLEYLKEDALHTTMTESMPLIAKWYGAVGKALGKIPGLQGVGKAAEMIAAGAEALALVYELIHEVKQAEALEKGSKQLIKRTKPVKRIAEALLKKKFPSLPEPARKKVAEILEQLLEKYGSDPAIEKGREKARELDESKDLEKTLWDELQKVLGTPPTATPATSPMR